MKTTKTFWQEAWIYIAVGVGGFAFWQVSWFFFLRFWAAAEPLRRIMNGEAF